MWVRGLEILWLSIRDWKNNSAFAREKRNKITCTTRPEVHHSKHVHLFSSKLNLFSHFIHLELYETNIALLRNSGPKNLYVMKSNIHQANWTKYIDDALQRMYAIAQIPLEGPTFNVSPQMPSWLSTPEILEECSERIYRAYSVPNKGSSNFLEERLSHYAGAIPPYEFWKLINGLLVRAYCYELKNPSISDEFPPVIPWEQLRRPKECASRRDARDLAKFAAKQLEV